ncbi:hypothetical protein LCGC14_1075190 [marine sediment metagenome]|uniref:GIY-YIG domain-containing protein n=1 Tax=marine sediment metagenome TaxID=412755 RepID=A0A0F9QMS8_9ZZZZ
MAEKISGIYRIVCIKNGRYYFGSAKNIHRRWLGHKSTLRRRKHNNPIIQAVWNKHGENSFCCELTEIVPINKLLEVEDVYLKENVGKLNCMNIAKDATAPMRDKIVSDETKLKLSEALKGNTNCKGHKHLPETLHKISEANKGKFCSVETRCKISEANKGKKRSAIARRKMSKAHINRQYNHDNKTGKFTT